MQVEFIKYFKDKGIDINSIDYFDYAEMFNSLTEEQLAVNPTKRKIVEKFIKKCEEKMRKNYRGEEKWKEFLNRMEEHKNYNSEKSEALKYINDHYDSKNKQLLFYPKVNKRKATQEGKFWKDTDRQILEEEPIEKPYDSTFYYS